jgi:hypothetical protein
LNQSKKKNSLPLNRFQPCEPQMFRVGDIVQVQLSFVVILVKAGRQKMLTILRSLALRDKTFTTKSVSLPKAIGKGEKTTPSVPPTLKRKVGYNLNNTDGYFTITRQKMYIRKN